MIPPYGLGRQAFIAKRLKVTQEAVRKWFSGASRPKPAIMQKLAHLLEADEAWLALGVKPEIDRKEKRSLGTQTEGAVFFLFGLATMAGATAAFASKDDPRSAYIDFYFIMNGVQYPVHVCVGREISKNVYEFIVPKEYPEVRCVGVVPMSHTRFHLLHLTPKGIEAHKQKKAGAWALTVSRKGTEYATGADPWPRIESFGELA
ncbi:MAG: helix-turn-helix transcriptional regulator [Pseudomonadota bacterium]